MLTPIRWFLAFVVLCLVDSSLLFSLPVPRDRQPVISPISKVEQSSPAPAIYGHLPLSFEPNRGQADSDVQFLSPGPGFRFSLCNKEAIIRFDSAQSTNAEATATSIGPCDKTTTGALRMKIINGAQGTRAAGGTLLPGVSNYYFGQNRSRWLTGIPNYASVVYRDIYPGIDLSYHGEQGQLEYDFELQPGKSEKPIRIQFPDARSIRLGPQGELLLSDTGKAVAFPKPFIFQMEKDTKRVIAGGYKLLGKNQVGFWVGPHDPNKPLTIDPVLLYSTNLPLTPTAVALDSAGNAYMTGQNATTHNVFINK